LILFFAGCMEKNRDNSDANGDKSLHKEKNQEGSYSRLTVDDPIRDIVRHPAFKGFAQHYYRGMITAATTTCRCRMSVSLCLIKVTYDLKPLYCSEFRPPSLRSGVSITHIFNRG